MNHINNYQSAIKFIQSHGHFATLTPDGVLARSEAVYTDGREDRLVEELEVFPVDHDGNVKAHDVRVWLGY
jgi:Ca2+-binding EF-hand superfamily protein